MGIEPVTIGVDDFEQQIQNLSMMKRTEQREEVWFGRIEKRVGYSGFNFYKRVGFSGCGDNGRFPEYEPYG